jgi:hypothetical protein
MTSWISYTTTNVSATFQGEAGGSFSSNQAIYFKGSIASTSSMGGTGNRTLLFLGNGTATRNSTIRKDGVTITAPKQSVTQALTKTTTGVANKITTMQGNGFAQPWTFSTYESYSDEDQSTTYPSGTRFFRTTSNINSTVRSQYTVPVTRTFTTNINTPPDITTLTFGTSTITSTTVNVVEFITWTDLDNDQIVIGHTIWQNPAGIAYISYGDFPELVTPNQIISSRDSENSNWEPITNAVWETATQITESYRPLYIQLSATEEPREETNYGVLFPFFDFTWSVKSEEADPFGGPGPSIITYSTIKTVVEGFGKLFPFTTSNKPPWWEDEEQGGEWPGYGIRKINTLVGVRTSRIGGDPYTYRTLISSTYYTASRQDGDWRTEETYEQGGTTVGEGYSRSQHGIVLTGNEQIVVGPFFGPPVAFGSPDLNFSQSQFTETPLFLELEGAQITLVDLSESYFATGLMGNGIIGNAPGVYRGERGQAQLNVPLPIPSFTTYVKPFTVGTDEDGFTYSEILNESSDWTTASITRQGASFSSSWSWNINSTSTASTSGTAKLIAKHMVGTDIKIAANRLSNAAGNAPHVMGGQAFPHRSFTISNRPNVLLLTTYDKSASGTLSRFENAYSEFTTKTFVGDDTLTISSWVSSMIGNGFKTLLFWEIDPALRL